MENYYKSLELHQYSIFHQNYFQLLIGKIDNNLRNNLEAIKNFMNIKENLFFITNLSVESMKFINIYDYIGLLHFSLKEYNFALDNFIKSYRFKLSLENLFLKRPEYTKLLLITIFNNIEIMTRTNFSEHKEEILNSIINIRPPIISTADELSIITYYKAVASFLSNKFDESRNFLEDIDKYLIKIQTAKFRNYIKLKKFVLLASLYKVLGNDQAEYCYKKILELYDNCEMKKGEDYLKYLILLMDCNYYKSIGKIKADFLNFQLNLIKKFKKTLDELSNVELGEIELTKFKLIIENKNVFLKIKEKSFRLEKSVFNNIDYFLTQPIENLEKLKLSYFVNRLIIEDKLINPNKCNEIIDKIMTLYKPDLFSIHDNIMIINNILCYLSSKINKTFNKKDLIEEFINNLRKVKNISIYTNKLISNFVILDLFSKEMIGKNTEIFEKTENFKKIVDIQKIDNNLICSNNKILYFLYNYYVCKFVDKRKIDLEFIQNIHNLSQIQFINFFISIINNNKVEQKIKNVFYIKLCYIIALEKYKIGNFNESLEFLIKADALIKNSNESEMNKIKQMIEYSDFLRLFGDVTFRLKLFNLSLENYESALSLMTKTNYLKNKGLIYYNIACIHYIEKKNKVNALVNLQLSIQAFEMSNDMSKICFAQKLKLILTNSE